VQILQTIKKCIISTGNSSINKLYIFLDKWILYLSGFILDRDGLFGQQRSHLQLGQKEVHINKKAGSGHEEYGTRNTNNLWALTYHTYQQAFKA
jgi:hypothetical protein